MSSNTVVVVDDQTAVATQRGETYGGRTRAQRATDRRDRIVASAVHLFGTRDYESITVADVCAGARVSKRYFYEHFADRADLVVAVHREQNEWLLGNLAAAAPDGPAAPADVLEPAMRTLVQLLRAYPERARVIYINALYNHNVDSTWQTQAFNICDGGFACLAAIARAFAFAAV